MRQWRTEASEEDTDNAETYAVGEVLVTGMADTKSTGEAAIAETAVTVTLNAMDSHSRDQQMVSRLTCRGVSQSPGKTLVEEVQGTDAITEADTTLGALEKDCIPQTIFPVVRETIFLCCVWSTSAPKLDAPSEQNLGGSIQGAGDEDWFVIKEMAPDYLLHLQIVGNANFEVIPASSVTADDMVGHTLMGRSP